MESIAREIFFGIPKHLETCESFAMIRRWEGKMVKAYPDELRTRIVEMVLGGESHQATADHFDVSKSMVGKTVRLHIRTGSVSPKPTGGSISPLDAHSDTIDAIVKEKPDITLDEVVKKLKRLRIFTSITSVWRYFVRHKLSFKKKTIYAAEQQRPDVVRARKLWVRNQKRLDSSRLVFIDETCVKTGMMRTHGWCEIGERLVDYEQLGQYSTFTFICGLTENGIIAPMIYKGAMNGERFLEYVEGCLAPSLTPGMTVVMDNLRVHKVEGVAEAIEAVDASVLFTPKYSPDLNPIGMFFSKMKSHLREAMDKTQQTIVRTIRKTMQGTADEECVNFFRHAGYGSI